MFWDLLRIRYGWAISRLPKKCSSGESFDLNHALSCKKGGFITIRHIHIQNITTASLMKEVCHDVRVEPLLQKLIGEITLNFKKLAMKLCHFLLKNYDKLCKIEEKVCQNYATEAFAGLTNTILSR